MPKKTNRKDIRGQCFVFQPEFQWDSDTEQFVNKSKMVTSGSKKPNGQQTAHEQLRDKGVDKGILDPNKGFLAGSVKNDGAVEFKSTSLNKKQMGKRDIADNTAAKIGYSAIYHGSYEDLTSAQPDD